MIMSVKLFYHNREMDFFFQILTTLLVVGDIYISRCASSENTDGSNVHVILPCLFPFSTQLVFQIQWYKSKRLDRYENGKVTVASWYDNVSYNTTGYGISDSFGLVISNPSVNDSALYRCIAKPSDDSDDSVHDVTFFAYELSADPGKDIVPTTTEKQTHEPSTACTSNMEENSTDGMETSANKTKPTANMTAVIILASILAVTVVVLAAHFIYVRRGKLKGKCKELQQQSETMMNPEAHDLRDTSSQA